MQKRGADLLFPGRKGKVVGKTRVLLAFAAATSAALTGLIRRKEAKLIQGR